MNKTAYELGKKFASMSDMEKEAFVTKMLNAVKNIPGAFDEMYTGIKTLGGGNLGSGLSNLWKGSKGMSPTGQAIRQQMVNPIKASAKELGKGLGVVGGVGAGTGLAGYGAYRALRPEPTMWDRMRGYLPRY